MAPPKGKPRMVKTIVPLTGGKIEVYAGQRIAAALEVFQSLGLYEGAKTLDLIEAVYIQGKKDGALNARQELEKVWDNIAHKKPGRPRKQKKKKQ